jgi:hypothetical protein
MVGFVTYTKTKAFYDWLILRVGQHKKNILQLVFHEEDQAWYVEIAPRARREWNGILSDAMILYNGKHYEDQKASAQVAEASDSPSD